MKVNDLKPGYLFAHPSLGLCMVIKVSMNDYILDGFVFKSETVKTFAIGYILQNCDERMVDKQFIGIKEVVASGALDLFFDEYTKRKATIEYVDSINIVKNEKEEINATIEGTFTYFLRIYKEKNVIKMKCSCPVNGNCKHLYALLKYLSLNLSSEDKEKEAEVGKGLIDLLEYNSCSSFEDVKEILNIRDKLKQYRTEDIIRYCLKKYYLSDTNLSKGLMWLIADDELYENIKKYSSKNKTYISSSRLLRNFPSIREKMIRGEYRYYYGFDEDIFLYHVYRQEFDQAARELEFLRNSTLKEDEYFLSYYIDDFYKIMGPSIFNYLKIEKNICETYSSIQEEQLKKIYSIVFKRILLKNHIPIVELDDYEQFVYVKTLYEHPDGYTNSEMVNYLKRNIPNMIKQGYDSLALDTLYSLYLDGTFSDNEFKKSISSLKDNSLLTRLFSWLD